MGNGRERDKRRRRRIRGQGLPQALALICLVLDQRSRGPFREEQAGEEQGEIQRRKTGGGKLSYRATNIVISETQSYFNTRQKTCVNRRRFQTEVGAIITV